MDRVLNNRGDVRSEVANQIRTIADSLGYVPNRAAKALRFNHSPKTIVVVLPKTSSGFFDLILSGVHRAEAELAGMGIRTRAVYFDPRDEGGLVSTLQTASADGDAFVVTGPDTAAVRSALLGIVESGTPVVTINSDIAVEGRLCFVGQNLYKSGVMAAELMAKTVRSPGRVVAVTGNLDFQAHRDRIEGFTAGMTRWSEDCDVTVGEGFDNYDDTRAVLRASFDQAAANGRRIVGVYMATGSIEASLAMLRERRQAGSAGADEPVRVITNDALPIVKEGLASGRIDFSICQDPVHQGTEPVRIIAEYLLSGKRPAADYRSPILVMGAGNMDEFQDHG